MYKIFGLLLVSAALIGLSIVDRHSAVVAPSSPQHEQRGGNAAPLSAIPSPQALFAGTPLEGRSPTRLLMEIAEPELAQRGPGPLPVGWKPEAPLDLSGPMPSDDSVRSAIVQGCEFLIEQQNENGSWDVELTGTLLSNTADDAVDAIAATSCVGIALRYHVKVDPERYGKALRRAAEFIIDRIYRGKLSLKVDYANWRYTLGLKFLHMEFMATGDEEYRAEIAAISRRMVQAMLKLQLSKNPAPLLERKRKARVSARMRNKAMPAQLGLVLDLPTDQSYRGGARISRILPGSPAEKAGLLVDDRIVGAEGLRVENAVDYYCLEAEWVGGQKVNIKIKREGVRDFARDITLEQTWPGYLGLRVSAGTGAGPTVDSFLRFSPAEGKLEIGDVLTKINNQPIANLQDYRAVESTVEPGKSMRVEVMRQGKRKTESFKAEPAPEGTFGFYISPEDKGDDAGVVVTQIIEGSVGETIGLREDDRVIWVGDTPISGIDQFVDFAGTIPAGRTMTVKWLRGTEEMSAEATAEPIVMAGDPQFEWLVENGPWERPIIEKITPNGVSERAGLKRGDVITAINDQEVQVVLQAYFIMIQIAAGDEVKIKYMRGAREAEAKFKLAKPKDVPPEEDDTEEGGWAYYPSHKTAPSFATACGILALNDITTDVVKPLARNIKPSLRAAENLIISLRVKDATAGNNEVYVYFEDGKTIPGGADIRGTMGRNAICELALYVRGRRNKSDIKRACDNFMKYRGELDAVRRMEFYQTDRGGSPHNFDRWWNAAYYWHFGHYHTLLGAKVVGSRTFKEVNDMCTKAVMKTRLDDGTWLDHPSFGKLIGTSLALWILGETEGGWRDGYSPTTQEKMDPEPDPGEPEE